LLEGAMGQQISTGLEYRVRILGYCAHYM
jgi:hypothetical protein